MEVQWLVKDMLVGMAQVFLNRFVDMEHKLAKDIPDHVNNVLGSGIENMLNKGRLEQHILKRQKQIKFFKSSIQPRTC